MKEEGRRKKEEVVRWGFRQGTFEEEASPTSSAAPTQNGRPVEVGVLNPYKEADNSLGIKNRGM
ncbi:MAG: hypothetical protein KME60_10665 [Cyanomargarita calcarea GSE-NOS-MK-12-04C]|jgi:hypothetical protein|uniref:Uncharacterized protein n=1 Tax=Cyanomargarita calcarea GSE-NOS-MK-12-04C TaxID=2839659 RepID=A0A951QMT1_9CYAN|nr:hypothetical protein [Cyanomargarita calcarea GSE-NOS-MK-12-04C]